MIRMLGLLLALVSCGQNPPPPGAAVEGSDWGQFLGPDQTGVSRETGLLKAWPAEGPPPLWTAKYGESYAAPVVVGDALVAFYRSKDEEVVERLDATSGKSVWKFAYPTTYVDRFGYNGGPRASAAIVDGKVYALGAECRLHCLERETGKVAWTRALHAEYFNDERQNFFGSGVAPRIDGDAILLNIGDDQAGCVTAIDRKTGKTLWKSTDDAASYSTPTVAVLGGVRQAVFLTRKGAVGVAVADGAVQWTYPFRSRERYSANACSPVVVGDTVLLSAAYQTGSALLRIGEKKAEEVWRNMALGAHWSTPIVHEGHAYGFDGRHEHEATLRCVRMSDGQVLWQKDGYERGSMIRVDGRWILLAEDGRMVLADLAPKGVTELSSFQAFPGKDCWAPPVLSRGRLYVTHYDHGRHVSLLRCYDVKEKR